MTSSTDSPIADSSRAANSILGEWFAAIRKPGIGALLALTIVGGILRFVRLSQPPLLYDEAAVYTRVVGSLRAMNATLRFDGFPPLHYEIYWLLARCVRLTPFIMRLIPALAGTLMIPAVFFLARQMFSPRVATLAAAITCFSAYQLVYSRDAKMYMELWLCATLFSACLLWWMRVGLRIAWLSWVAAGCAMNGVHALGLCVTGVALIIVLLSPGKTRKRFNLALIGLVITCAGAAGYYAFFNQWGQQIHEVGWHTSGLDWIDQRGRGMSKPFVVWDTLASWVLAYRSPRPPINPPHRVIVPVVIVSTILGILLLLGVFPWPRRLRDDDPDDAPASRGALWMAAWLVLPPIGFAIVNAVGGHDVWNARYLAIVWPALAVLMALAIQRLPAPWLRASAIGLLIGANVFQFALRLTVESGVPVDKIAYDVATANASRGTIQTVVAVKDDPKATSLGGSGGIFDFPGRYYLAVDLGIRLLPIQLRDEPFRQQFSLKTDVADIPPTVHRLIVWADDAKVAESADPILAQLGPGWTRLSVQEHAVKDFWCWRRMFRCTRTLYLRTDDSAAAPAMAPPVQKHKAKRKK